MPMIVVPTIKAGMDCAVAQIMAPRTPSMEPLTKTQRRPKMSEMRPIMVRVTAEVRV
jgi:hypothetical protein